VGDVMTDVLYRVRDRLADTPLELGVDVEPGKYYVATIHRPDNTDDPDRLRAIIDGMAGLDAPVLLLAHPRLRHLAKQHGIELNVGAIVAREPLGYPELVKAVVRSAGVITDSGGLQKEAFLLRVPCTTLRPETEWVETVELGWNALCNDRLDTLSDAVERAWPEPTDAAPYGTGRAAEQAVLALEEYG
ncbi:MAG: UDP-N-acetylglucosamine 2-epimerase, partial [Sciscionella sp.]